MVKIGSPNWSSGRFLVTMESHGSTSQRFNDKGAIMARTLANSLEKHPLRLTLGLAINLGGALAIAVSL